MQVERKVFLEIKKILDRIESTSISINQFKDYYVFISNALINNDISNKLYVEYLNVLKNASVNLNTTDDMKRLYNQVCGVIDEKITKYGIIIVKENYKKIREMNFEISDNITADLFIKLCGDFDYSEVMQVDGIDYVWWAKKLEELNPICENASDIQKVSEYKALLSNYVQQKKK